MEVLKEVSQVIVGAKGRWGRSSSLYVLLNLSFFRIVLVVVVVFRVYLPNSKHLNLARVGNTPLHVGALGRHIRSARIIALLEPGVILVCHVFGVPKGHECFDHAASVAAMSLKTKGKSVSLFKPRKINARAQTTFSAPFKARCFDLARTFPAGAVIQLDLLPPRLGLARVAADIARWAATAAAEAAAVLAVVIPARCTQWVVALVRGAVCDSASSASLSVPVWHTPLASTLSITVDVVVYYG